MNTVEQNFLSGSPTAEDLQIARRVAEVFQRRLGDRLLVDEMDAWERERRNGGAGARRLAAGYASYHQGSIFYKELRTEDAKTQFLAAARDLSSSESPLRFWSEYWVAVCIYWRGDLAGAGDRLEILAATVPREYLLLHGYITWLSGLIAARESDFDRAIGLYRRAMEIFEQVGATEEAGFSHVLLAQVMGKPVDCQQRAGGALSLPT